MSAKTAATWAGLLTGAVLALSSCATTPQPQQFQKFFVPPSRPVPTSVIRIEEPPVPALDLYAYEVPKITGSIPAVSRPTDADFLIKTADDHFAAGKRAMQDGHTDDARREFDRAIEGLLAAPSNIPDRARLERRLDELVQSIYKYDVDELGAGQEEDDFVKSPLDGIIDMTFPTDPGLRHRVQDQIRVTASQLPLEMQDPVVSYINFFSSTQGKKIIISGLKHSGRYKALIERVLREEGVPQELIYLAQAESGFQPRARSNKECVGIWQFIGFRGREYGLMQTPATDDRMDPEKATRAAARHLHDLYNHFGDWYLAMAAYNCGPGCVDQAVMRTGYTDFWTLRRLNALPKETANYVPIILAMTLMGKNAKDYGLEFDMEQALDYDTIELEAPTHLALIAAAADRPLSELREYNPSLLRLVAPAGFALHLPKGTQPGVEAALAAVPASKRDSWRVHKVDSDDTFATLAKRYGAPLSSISSVNRDTMPEAGSWAVIPVAYPGDPVASVARARSISRKLPVRAALRKPSTRSNATAAKPAVPAVKAAAPKMTGRTTASARKPARVS